MLLPDLFAIFMMGLLGAGHCLAMCGGVASAMSMQSGHQWLHLSFYNIGRLFSYGVMGALVGGLVGGMIHATKLTQSLIGLRIASAILMMLLALQIGQFFNGLIVIEKMGRGLWRLVSPLTQKILPLKTPFHAFPLGMLWGWLPCGLVYSALSWAALSSSSLSGFWVMLAFGLGTLPSMFLIGATASKIKTWLNHSLVRKLFALVLFSYGSFTLYLAGSH